MTTEAAEAVGPADDARGFVHRSPIAMGTVIGPDYVWILGNDAYRELSGRPNLLGRPMREIFPEFEGQGVFDLLDRVRRTGEPVTVDDFRLHIEIDGVQEERTYDFSWFPSQERDDDGGARYIDIVVVNVTERVAAQRRSEQAAREAEQRYADVRDVVSVLQTALLGGDLPIIPELDLAASYLLAGEDQAAGGDWFDAVVRPDGRVALVAGDVVGHGVRAAAVMGQLRAALRDRLLGQDSVTAALAGLDRFARATDGARNTSVCVVEINPSTGVGEYCTAGHPPPMVVTVSGEVLPLKATGGPLLASSRGDADFVTEPVTLERDEVVLLYTDGLVERPGRTAGEGTQEALQYVADAVAGRSFPLDPGERTVDRVTRRSLEMLTRVSGYADDITLLAAQRIVPITPYLELVSADAASVAVVRTGLAEWMHAVGLDASGRLVLDHALSELVSNVAAHAYRDRDLPARPEVTPAAQASRASEVAVRLDPFGVVRAQVRDFGRWTEASADGRGLAMIRRLADEFTIDHDHGGTTARFTMRATRQADLLKGTTKTSRRPVGPEVPFSISTNDDTVIVTGPVDLSNSVLLEHAIRTAGQGGARLVRVDLAAVTHLGSAGIRVLDTALDSDALGIRAKGTGAVQLTTSRGSVAQHILDLVRLPYDVHGAEEQ